MENKNNQNKNIGGCILAIFAFVLVFGGFIITSVDSYNRSTNGSYGNIIWSIIAFVAAIVFGIYIYNMSHKD